MNTVTREQRRHTRRVYKKVSDIVGHIVRTDDRDEMVIVGEVYRSDLYRLLADESTKLWWLSTPALLEAYRTERETGDIGNSPYVDGLAE
ncbi:MAG: hypothetical protein FWG23_00010 [Eggerthellaceae bacterium]|jgi:hypothetical protein|nr:hypothetical protein [Eggerthellaceae bacterium]